MRAVRINMHLKLYTVVAELLGKHERILDIYAAVIRRVPQEALRRLVSDAVLKREIVFLIFILFTKQILTAADMTEFVGDVDYRITEYRAVRQRRVFVDIVGSVTLAGDVVKRDGRSREVSAGRKAERYDTVRVNLPLFRMGTDNFDSALRVCERRGMTVRRDAIIDYDSVHSARVEEFGYRLALMRRADRITSARVYDDAGERLIGVDEICSHAVRRIRAGVEVRDFLVPEF